MGLLILRISFGRTKYVNFQLDLELHLPGVTGRKVVRVFVGQSPESLRGHEADN
jgi:hypothetical protein